MAQTTIAGGGAFTKKNIDDINANTTELYAGISGGTFANPAITGTVTGGASYTAPTLTAPVITGAATIATGSTITAPAIVGATITGTVTIANGSTITTPVLSGSVTGTYTLAGTPTLTSPTINTPTVTGGTITGATITGAVASDYKVLAAPITYTSNVTPAVITGFSWTVVAGTYIFEMNLPTVMTVNGGLTVSFVLTTAVLTSIQYQSYASTAVDNTTAVSTTGTTASSTTKVFDSKTSAYTYVKVWGSMVVGTGGTFAWDGCQNTSAGGGDVTTLPIGAYARMTRIA